MADYNIQKTTTASLSPTMQTYYDKRLLENMKPDLVHYEFGQKRNLKPNSGKIIQFRKVTPFAAITTPLVEGVIPDGQAMEITEMTATVEEYGGYVSVSSKLNLTAIDDVKNEASDQCSQQGALSVDTITRDAIHLGTNKIVANGKTYRWRLTAADKLTTTEIRKAVRALKKANAKPFIRNGRKCYIAIVGPDTTYDLQSDQLWQDVSKYQDKEQIFSGEIGRIFGVVFVETTEAKLLAAEDLIGASATLTVAATGGYTAGTKTLLVQQAISAAEALALAGRKIIITSGATGAVSEQDTVASATSGTAGTCTLVLTTGLSDGTVTNYNSVVVYPGEAGAAGAELASTLVLGQNAYGVVDIEGSSKPELIVTPASVIGGPLRQFSTVGWKVPAYVTKILQNLFMVRIEHGYSA